MTENYSSSLPKKRKCSCLSEESENFLSSSSVPSSVFSSKITSEIDDCTLKWNKNTLNKIGIECVTTKAIDPMGLISFAFNLRDPNLHQRVERCKKLVSSHKILGIGPNVLDVADVEAIGIASSSVLKMIAVEYKYRWHHDVGIWNLQPPDWNDQLDIRLFQKFRVHGELFVQHLVNMSMIKTTQKLTEAMYQSLFQEFAAVFGLMSLSAPVVGEAVVDIREKAVTSIPNIVFPDITNSEMHHSHMKILAVCKVKEEFREKEDMDVSCQCHTGSGKKKETSREQEIQHIDDQLHGQHGGDLLIHYPLSENNGVLGIIVQKTYVTFTYFQCNSVQFEEVRTGNRCINSPVVYYSRPYNYLKAADRNKLITPLLTLGFIQFSPCCMNSSAID